VPKVPPLPLSTEDYLGDTQHLSIEQSGAYLHLLMHAWRIRTGALPDDDVLLRRVTRMSPRQWQANKATIMELWKKGADGLWRQKRLTEVLGEVHQLSETRARAGRASHQVRHAPAPKTGKRLPANWKPSQKDVDYAKKRNLTRSEIVEQANLFKNYWLAKTGQLATKLDWHRTWCNWIINAIKRGQCGPQTGAGQRTLEGLDQFMERTDDQQ